MKKKKNIKEATKLSPKIIFVSATKIGEITTNILNCYFLCLSHQTKQIQIEN